MNIQIAEKTIKELVNLGIHSFCLCPGARLAPFVEVLSHSKELEVLSFFEERSACFFALGRARRNQKPVAVLSTSGTAVAELLPAVIEAYYSALPLVLITADRPLTFGKKGSPQTLKSAVHILKDYCHTSKNILKQEDVHLSDWNFSQGHLHLNVCFDEPLLDEKIPSLDFSSFKEKKLSIYPSADLFSSSNETKNNSYTKSFYVENKKTPLKRNIKKESHKEIKKFFQVCKKPLLIVGELKPQEKPSIKDLLIHYKGLFYTEPLSGLDNIQGRLLSGERILNYAFKKREIDGVVRLGGVPRVRFWRDLEKYDIPVLNISSPPFYPGLARDSFNWPLLENIDVLKSHLSSLEEFGNSLKEFDQTQLERWKNILIEHPQSEEFWLWTLKKSLSGNSKVFLGNSSPIRLWDMLAFCRKKDLCVTGQSGVNGIDGLVSRFLGECESEINNIGILGDLSLLYDMAGFWRAKDIPPWTLVVINNFGGQIFSRLFKNPSFLNKHKLSFSSLAEVWGLNYEFYKNSENFYLPKKAYNLIEIAPKKEDTQDCFKKYVSIWDNF